MIDMRDLIIAANDVLLNEQAELLRQCKQTIEALVREKPETKQYLSELLDELDKLRPKGVMQGVTKWEDARERFFTD